MVNELQRCSEERTVLKKKVLIQKDPAKDTKASNYRPIFCSPFMPKTAFRYLCKKSLYLLFAQPPSSRRKERVQKESKVTKRKLLIDKVGLKEAKKLRKKD